MSDVVPRKPFLLLGSENVRFLGIVYRVTWEDDSNPFLPRPDEIVVRYENGGASIHLPVALANHLGIDHTFFLSKSDYHCPPDESQSEFSFTLKAEKALHHLSNYNLRDDKIGYVPLREVLSKICKLLYYADGFDITIRPIKALARRTLVRQMTLTETTSSRSNIYQFELNTAKRYALAILLRLSDHDHSLEVPMKYPTFSEEGFLLR